MSNKNRKLSSKRRFDDFENDLMNVISLSGEVLWKPQKDTEITQMENEAIYLTDI